VIPADLVHRLKTDGRLMLTLKVVPKASRDEVVGVLEDGALKVKVTAAPDRGKANAAVCELLAEAFGVPKRNVEIVRGETSHTKQVRVVSTI
jgi:uncharacterized protein (TIGR00251 family)